MEKPVSVIVPVKDAGPLLEEALAAVRRQGDVELIVVDSGSRDGSQDVARAAGVTLIEIPPEEFGHGRTRNLAAERSSGELICFLTQDAVPEPGWLDAYREAFELDDRVGAAFGPHLPHPDTSPMIARELVEFFAGFSPDGKPALHRHGDLTFLSNVNACYARECWEEVRFADVAYSEDQAFGAAMLEAGWVKVFHPGARVRHAHDYGPVEFLKRYFDEYRGLRETTGHVEPLNPRGIVSQVRGDARWMRERGWDGPRRAGWLARSAVHHAARRAGSTLGSRHDRLPEGAQRMLSLERRGGTANGGGGIPRGATVRGEQGPGPYEDILRFSRDGPAPLAQAVPGMSEGRLHIAAVIPPFQRGSGGHNTLFTLLAGLEEFGHTCSIWMYDPHGRDHRSGAVIRRRIVEEFVPLRAPAHRGFDDWNGADVALATGWDTAYAVSLLPGCRARAYLIQDHEPEFFATSADSVWAERTYELGLYGIAASRWLRDLLARRYSQRGGWFRLGVNHGIYHPRPVERRPDTVMFYARHFTPRRAVPLGALALEELHRRRPDVHIVLFGQAEEMKIRFPHEQLGVVSAETLALRYSEAAAGLCLSLTNYSLIPQEMMACGLPCVDLAGGSTEAELGRDGGVVLAEADPIAIADALERLLDDRAEWERRSEAGLAQVQTASWDVAARQVEAGLREALKEREPAEVRAP
ncbi:MAG TPA: glycosyltransferase [Thermoleophilaceae bacterium]|nr:glycosyltransferase [Thermoleophilaceae bacterium]